MENFTPYSALLGGIFIGIAVSLLLLFNGRIAGISGIVRGILPPWQEAIGWRFCFIAGLVIAPLLFQFLGGKISVQFNNSSFPVIIFAGLLVGYGTSLGSGCTSGHSVCGLSRLSIRSAVATGIFMFTAAVTVYLTRHVF
jgi:uncharacterized protein